MTTRYPRTLPGLFDRALRKYADRTAIRDERRSLSYTDLDDRSARLADALVDLGVGAADRVGVLLGNAAASPVVDIGILRAGGARLPLNPQHSADELQYLLDDAGAETLVCDAPRRDAVATASRTVDSLRTVIVVGADDDASTGADTMAVDDGPELADGVDLHRYESLLARHDGDGDRPTPDPDDTAGHYYTGGTTGRPKGVCYSHRGLVENVGSHLLEFGFDGGDVGLLTTPLSHSAGTFCWAALLGGGTVLLRDGFDPEDVVATIERADVTWTFLVPTMLYRLLDDDSLAAVDHASLDRIVYGAAPMRTDRLEEAIERIGPVFHQFYGQTEVPNLVTTFPPQEHARAAEAGDTERLRSAGTPCLRATVEVRDPETDEALPPGEVGEVVVAAPYAFEGYYERPDATDETLRDGWVYTGDIGTMDADGYLTLLDRSSDVIVTGGMNVYSRTVERVLRDHSEVADAAVVGVPDDEWGEAVHAVVVPARSTVDEADLRGFADERLAGYKKPKSYEVAASLPTTELGKVDRNAIRERYWNDEDRSIH
ncbi:class I adenylate-forming enzyme family protein [Haloarcula salina]|uniref:AMP-binding protein n=1 Tax=Haloarcula salina TaxID=1429914 RepID=A0AA41KG75_9EURY|nr:AMP-binding protein [Haloarcula salina]MBV0902802.1 AMP-binding protein [Haloarcula salina]